MNKQNSFRSKTEDETLKDFVRCLYIEMGNFGAKNHEVSVERLTNLLPFYNEEFEKRPFSKPTINRIIKQIRNNAGPENPSQEQTIHESQSKNPLDEPWTVSSFIKANSESVFEMSDRKIECLKRLQEIQSNIEYGNPEYTAFDIKVFNHYGSRSRVITTRVARWFSYLYCLKREDGKVDGESNLEIPYLYSWARKFALRDQLDEKLKRSGATAFDLERIFLENQQRFKGILGTKSKKYEEFKNSNKTIFTQKENFYKSIGIIPKTLASVEEFYMKIQETKERKRQESRNNVIAKYKLPQFSYLKLLDGLSVCQFEEKVTHKPEDCEKENLNGHDIVYSEFQTNEISDFLEIVTDYRDNQIEWHEEIFGQDENIDEFNQMEEIFGYQIKRKENEGKYTLESPEWSAIIPFDKGAEIYQPCLGTPGDYSNANLQDIGAEYFNRCVDILSDQFDAGTGLDLMRQKAEGYIENAWKFAKHRLTCEQKECKQIRHSMLIASKPEEYYERSLQISSRNQAYKDVTKAIELGFSESEAYHRRAIVKQRENEIREVYQEIEDFSEAIRLNPENHKIYRDRGWYRYEFIKDYNKAIEDFTKVIELMPESGDGYYERGLCRYELKDYEKVIEDFNNALKFYDENFESVLFTEPENAEFDLYMQRGKAQYELKDYKKAIEDYSKSIKLRSHSYEINYLYARLLHDMGEKSDAELYYTKAIELYPDPNPNIKLEPGEAIAQFDIDELYLNRGKLYEQMEKHAEMIKDFSKYSGKNSEQKSLFSAMHRKVWVKSFNEFNSKTKLQK